jgi:polar amino acid transport system permease protein
MGLDWEFILKFFPVYGRALLLTIKLSALGILFSAGVGAICGLILYFKVPAAGRLVRGYIELARNTPLLIQLYFLYYGVSKLGLVMSGETCALIGLVFLGGGYMAEAFRSGLEAVSKAQVDSGLSLGLDTAQLVRHVILPQALSVAMPALGANCIFLIKETSVVSIIALQDIMSLTRELIGMYYRTVETLAMLVVCYLFLLLPASFLFTRLERKLRYAEFGV